jgi:hypothetical protein
MYFDIQATGPVGYNGTKKMEAYMQDVATPYYLASCN